MTSVNLLDFWFRYPCDFTLQKKLVDREQAPKKILCSTATNLLHIPAVILPVIKS